MWDRNNDWHPTFCPLDDSVFLVLQKSHPPMIEVRCLTSEGKKLDLIFGPQQAFSLEIIT